MQEARQLHASVSAQLQTNERNRRLAEFTIRDLETTPADTRTFVTVGRMYMLTPKAEVIAAKREESEERANKIRDLTASQAALDKRVRAAEADFRSLIESMQKK